MIDKPPEAPKPEPLVRRYPMTTVFAGMAVDAARTTWGQR